MSLSFLEFFTRVNFTDLDSHTTVNAARRLEKTSPIQQIRYQTKRIVLNKQDKVKKKKRK